MSGNLGMAYEILCNLEEAQEHYTKVRRVSESVFELHTTAQCVSLERKKLEVRGANIFFSDTVIHSLGLMAQKVFMQ